MWGDICAAKYKGVHTWWTVEPSQQIVQYLIYYYKPEIILHTKLMANWLWGRHKSGWRTVACGLEQQQRLDNVRFNNF
jgi:hypothetical protein